MRAARLVLVAAAALAIAACGRGPAHDGAAGVQAVARPAPSPSPVPAADRAATVPRGARPADDGRRAPLAGDEPSAADYLGLGRWSCDEVAEMTGGLLRRLATGHDVAQGFQCYVLNGGEGEPFAPATDPGGPWQAGVLYAAGDPGSATLDDLLDAGGVLLSVDFGVPEPPPPGDDATTGGDESSLWTEVGGEPAVLHRTSATRLAGVWFTGAAAEGERVRVILMTGGDERRALELMGAVEAGAPR